MEKKLAIIARQSLVKPRSRFSGAGARMSNAMSMRGFSVRNLRLGSHDDDDDDDDDEDDDDDSDAASVLGDGEQEVEGAGTGDPDEEAAPK